LGGIIAASWFECRRNNIITVPGGFTMKKRMLILAGFVFLNLALASSAVAGMSGFTLNAQGTEGCMSARIIICGQPYTLNEGANIQCMGETPVISNIPVSLQWGGSEPARR
jgi:hypothetical protein